jgi:hypothetical protein
MFCIVWVFVCSLRYPAWKAHAICSLSGSATFSTLSHTQHDSLGRKKLFKKMCFFYFSTNSSDTFLILRKIQGSFIINSCFPVKYFLFLSVFMKIQFSREVFEKYSNTKFHLNPSSSSELLYAEGQTDINDQANSSFSQFCVRVWEKGG